MIVTLLTVALVVLLGALAVVHLNCREARDDAARWARQCADEARRHNEAAFRMADEIAGMEQIRDVKDAELARRAEVLRAAETEIDRLSRLLVDRHCNCEDADAKHQQTVAFLRDIANRIGSHLTMASKGNEIPF